MVKLNAKSVIKGKDAERVLLWEQIIIKSLCKRTKYVCISKKPMVGCFILLFSKDSHKSFINQIRTSKVKTGFAGQSGNKGAVAIRFNYQNSSFAFINCHLTSGQNEVSERLQDLRDIYSKSFDCS
jgi:synaptojanin